MTKQKKTRFSLSEVSKFFWVSIPAMALFLLVYLARVFNPTLSQSDSGRLQVQGIENKVQYLTSLVLTTPSGEELFLNYDSEGAYLRVLGTINADEISIGANVGAEGSALLGGSGNALTKSTNATFVGGESHVATNAINPTILGGVENQLSNVAGATLLGGEKNVIDVKGGKNISIVGGEGNRVVSPDATPGQNIVIFGSDNAIQSKDVVVMGKKVALPASVDKVFVWSQDDNSFSPKSRSAFYVNTENGLILNKTSGNADIDIEGALRTYWGGDSLALVKNNQGSEGMVVYVGEGAESAFCGYDGTMWTPLSEDTTTHWLCKGGSQTCEGTFPKNLGDTSHGGKVVSGALENSEVISNGSRTYLPRWDAEAAKWVLLEWNFNVVNPGECTYQCGVGYHPGGYGMDGHPLLDCKVCSYIDNMYDWKSAGTGEDNCDFGCKASYLYTNGDSKRSCTDCGIGTYTAPDGHQSTFCSFCTKPQTKGLPVDAPAGEEGFLRFTTNGTGEYACDFDCKERYSYYFSYDADNSCTWCAVGTYSPGGKTKVCNNCTNKPGAISYWVNGVSASINPASSYTRNGTRQDDCEWKCNRSLIKSGNACICEDGQHLESGDCRSNNGTNQCQGVIPSNAYGVTPTRYAVRWLGAWNNGRWPIAKNWQHESQKKASDLYRDACLWECNGGYAVNENNYTQCMKKTQMVSCGGTLPADTVAGAAQYEQTRNGTSYIPSTKNWSPTGALNPGACEYRAKVSAACKNGVHNTNKSSLSQTSILCEGSSTLVAGSFVERAADIYVKHWEWKCGGDGAEVSCYAHKENPNQWKCDRVNLKQCLRTGDPDSPKPGVLTPGFVGGTQWQCADQVWCTVCNSDYQGTTYDVSGPAECRKIVSGTCAALSLSEGSPNLSTLPDSSFCTSGTPKLKAIDSGATATWFCEGANGGGDSEQCSATCPSGSVLIAGVCTLQTFNCTGTPPANSKPASDYEASGLTANTPRTLVGADNASVKCERVCDDGFVYDSHSNVCVKANCIGTIPTGGKANNSSKNDTAWKYSSSPGACTYTCDTANGYTWNGSSCVADKIDGKCGSSNNKTVKIKPTTGLCDVGTATTVTWESPRFWKWSCQSPNTGTTDSCSSKYQRRAVDTNCMFDDKLFIYNGVSYVIAGCNSTLNPTYSVNNTQQDNTPMYNRLDAGPDEIYGIITDGLFGGMYTKSTKNNACPAGRHVPTKSEIEAWVKSFSMNIDNARYPNPEYTDISKPTDVVRFVEEYHIPLNGSYAAGYPFPHGRYNYANILFQEPLGSTYTSELAIQRSMYAGHDGSDGQPSYLGDLSWLSYSDGWSSDRRGAVRCMRNSLTTPPN